MFPFRKPRPRREMIRERFREGAGEPVFSWRNLADRDVLVSLGIAAAFCALAIGFVMLRDDMVRYRPGQYSPQDILSRVDFTFVDRNNLNQLRQRERDQTSRIYKASGADAWQTLQEQLEKLPDRLAGKSIDELPRDLVDALQLSANQSGALAQFQNYARPDRIEGYRESVRKFVDSLRHHRTDHGELKDLILLPDGQRQRDLERSIVITPGNLVVAARDYTYSTGDDDFRRIAVKKANDLFLLPLPSKIAAFTCNTLRPTHELDEAATTEAQNRAADLVPQARAEIPYPRNQILVTQGLITERDWHLLKAEQAEFVRKLGSRVWKSKLGIAGVVLLLTAAMAAYVARYQPRIIHNHARAVAMAALLLSMLLLSVLAAVGAGPLYVFGVAPTVAVAMILAIVYDQRFALGISTFQAILVSTALDQGIGFFLILWAGVVTCCFLLHDVRTRSKLVEVGGAVALAMVIATLVAGGITYDPIRYIGKNCLAVGAAGLGVGIVVLAILPFIERAFRITTSMSLLELADSSQPLLRRLADEAPGTYSHCLQTGMLAEAAAEAIGSNGLLCRVGSYYHDIGKMNKPDYFVENQAGGANRHLNLSPNVSLLIIVGHVKDGIEMAKDFALPTILIPFIQQHHGTMLVEYFYHRARSEQDPNDRTQAEITDTQFRYPGPKPKTKEVAIVMLADAVESAARAMVDPTSTRVETLVHELSLKRLLDGQYDDCALTFREVEQIERSMAKTLLGIHHQRITYPSTAAMTNPDGVEDGDAAAKTA